MVPKPVAGVGQGAGDYLAPREDVRALSQQPARLGQARLCLDERPCPLRGDKRAALPARPGQLAKQDDEAVRPGPAGGRLAYALDTGPPRGGPGAPKRSTPTLGPPCSPPTAPRGRRGNGCSTSRTRTPTALLRPSASGARAGAAPERTLPLYAQPRLLAEDGRTGMLRLGPSVFEPA